MENVEQSSRIYNMEDGIRLILIKSSIDDGFYHVILEFIELQDYDNTYLSKEQIEKIYKIKL